MSLEGKSTGVLVQSGVTRVDLGVGVGRPVLLGTEEKGCKVRRGGETFTGLLLFFRLVYIVNNYRRIVTKVSDVHST